MTHHCCLDSCICGSQWQAQYSCTGCGSTCGLLNTATGTFSEGSGLSGYLNNANCEWMIAPYGAVQITIQFTAFSTQPTNDVVRVFQCSDVYCSQQQQLAELSGTYPGIQTITSMSGYMRVVFTSDGSVNYDGFTASWSSVSTLEARLFFARKFSYRSKFTETLYEHM